MVRLGCDCVAAAEAPVVVFCSVGFGEVCPANANELANNTIPVAVANFVNIASSGIDRCRPDAVAFVGVFRSRCTPERTAAISARYRGHLRIPQRCPLRGGVLPTCNKTSVSKPAAESE